MIYEEESDEEKEEIQIEDLEKAPPKMENNKPQVHDHLEEVNLATVEAKDFLHQFSPAH